MGRFYIAKKLCFFLVSQLFCKKEKRMKLGMRMNEHMYTTP